MRRAHTTTATFAIAVALGAGAASGATLSGRVTDANGDPVVNADLDFTQVSTGLDVPASGDKTGPDGTYVTLVPAGIYDVFYEPPDGSRLAAHVERNVNLFSNQSIDVVLADAWLVSGTVLRADTGGPAAQVDLDFTDLTTGEDIFTPRDDTDALGAYSVAVPPGIYDVTYEVPGDQAAVEGLVPFELRELSVVGDADVALPSVTLAAGFLVEGVLLDAKGDALVGADVDFLLSGTGEKILTTNDNTNANGFFDPIVPPGEYDVELRPEPATEVAVDVVPNVPVFADTVLGILELPDGFVVSGTVADAEGTPLADVELSFLDALGEPYPVRENTTGVDGGYAVSVPAGTWDITFAPLTNPLVGTARVDDVAVSTNRVLDEVALPFADMDGDGAVDVDDICPALDDAQSDADLDGVGDACDLCPDDADPLQVDDDRDGLGNACDDDDDGDGLLDAVDPDGDGDGVDDGVDLCPAVADRLQLDRDGDGTGDACDLDDRAQRPVVWLDTRTLSAPPELAALDYQVYRQRGEWLSEINYGPCVAHGLKAPVYVDEELPAPGELFVYLMAPRDGTGVGALGRGVDGTERPNLRPCPAPAP